MHVIIQIAKKSDIGQGLIEDQDLVQVDFANAFIGGGVLGEGCVQEEIRFIISPELIVSKFLCTKMEDNECIIITGSERFSSYTGYGRTYRLKDTVTISDDTPRDNRNRRKTQIVAIDALNFSQAGYIGQLL